MLNQGLTMRREAIFGKLDEVRQPKVLVLNKVDIVGKAAAARRWRRPRTTRGKFAATFMVSALTGDGVGDLRDWLAAHVPAGPWHYPEDEVSDAPVRQLAAEITREKLLSQAASGIALPVDGRDRDLDGAQGRLGAHRADDLRGARKPEEDRAGQGGPARSRRSARRRAASLPASWRSRCTCFCS